MPPCDRCRRLRMDCVKNLTSCAGCTKKHARCHWREVSREEVGALDHLMESAYADSAAPSISREQNAQLNGLSMAQEGDAYADESDDDDSNPLEDLEALGEAEEREKELADQRLKDDEEGLRNARELSRQGWEDGLRSGRSSEDLNGDARPRNSHDAQPTHDLTHQSPSAHVEHSVALERDVPLSTPQVHDYTNGLGPTPTPSRGEAVKMGFAPLLGEVYQQGSPPVHGAFRAVNELVVVNGDTVATPLGSRAM